MKTIIDIEAFSAHQVSNGIILEEKNSGYLKPGLFLTLFGSVCAAFSFVMAESPLKKILSTILEYTLWYAGLTLAIFGLYCLFRSLNIIKPKKVTFDIYKKEVELRTRSIPFSAVEGISHFSIKMLGRFFVKLSFKEKGLNVPLIGPPIIRKEYPEQIETLVAELKKMIKS